jgi:hypothetical protein
MGRSPRRGPVPCDSTSLRALLLSGLAPAAATNPLPLGQVDLDWVAPAECPTRDQVLLDARGLVSREHPAKPSDRIAVRAVVEPTGDGRWRLTLKVGASTREVEATSCGELSRAAGLFLALLIDPLRSQEPAEDTAEKATEPEPSGRPPPPPSPPSPPRPKPQPRIRPSPQPEAPSARWAIGGGGLLDHGTLPETAVMGELNLELRLRHIALTAYGATGPTQRHSVSASAGADLTPWIAALGGCYMGPRAGGTELGFCLNAEVGMLRAQAFGPRDARSGAWPWLGVEGAVSLRQSWWEHLELSPALGVAAPLYRPRLKLEGIAPVAEVAEPTWAIRVHVLARYCF